MKNIELYFETYLKGDSIKSFRTTREEVLDMNLFYSISHVQAITDEWLIKYNGERPHESLGNLTPWEFSEKLSIPTEVLH